MANSITRTLRLPLNFASITVFCALAVLYCRYVGNQNADAILESQFLHFRFLQELAENRLTLSGFFTSFAEHVFAGYNLILAINYAVFGVSGKFDSYVHAAFVVATALIVFRQINYSVDLNKVGRFIAALVVAFLLLSTTHNPQWGMALAACGGVFLIVVAASGIAAALESGDRVGIVPLAALLAANVLFLGGYAIGSAGAVCLVLLLQGLRKRTLSRNSLVIAAILFFSIAVYVLLVESFGVLGDNSPKTFDSNVISMVSFAVVMTGASVLGKTFFEQFGDLSYYYALGVALIFFAIYAMVSFARHPNRTRTFLLILLAYSGTNILVVSLFRYKNGLEGALGQWYNVHTQFVPVAVVFFLCSAYSARAFLPKLGATCLIAAISAGTYAGYLQDWRKAPYVAEYKLHFAGQAISVLEFPDSIKDKGDVTQSMLWDYRVVKPAIEFLYSKKLWIFKGKKAVVSGLTEDKWLTANTPLTILCPANSTKVAISTFRPLAWPDSTVEAQTSGSTRNIRISNSEQLFVFPPEGAKVLLIDGRHVDASRPMPSDRDTRPLISLVPDVVCKLD